MKNIISGIIGGIVFSFFYLLLDINIFLSILAAIVGSFAIILILPQKKDSELKLKMGLSHQEINKLVGEGHTKVKNMRDIVNSIANDELKKKGLDICEIADKIYDDFLKDPDDIVAARKFINYYLDATNNIITRYRDLYNSNLDTVVVSDRIKKSLEVLDTIKAAFEKQFEKLLENDVLDLDTEIELLEKTIKMENLGGK